jgi:hypothetical protein
MCYIYGHAKGPKSSIIHVGHVGSSTLVFFFSSLIHSIHVAQLAIHELNGFEWKLAPNLLIDGEVFFTGSKECMDSILPPRHTSGCSIPYSLTLSMLTAQISRGSGTRIQLLGQVTIVQMYEY